MKLVGASSFLKKRSTRTTRVPMTRPILRNALWGGGGGRECVYVGEGQRGGEGRGRGERGEGGRGGGREREREGERECYQCMMTK